MASSNHHLGAVIAAALFAALAASSQPLAAGGSVAFSDIQDLLDQQPAIKSLLAESLEVAAGGMAVRIGSHHPALGGKRMGPFEFDAKPRGEPGPFTLALIVCTVHHFLDAEGNSTTFEDAVDIKEELIFVKLAQLEKGAHLDDCAREEVFEAEAVKRDAQ